MIRAQNVLQVYFILLWSFLITKLVFVSQIKQTVGCMTKIKIMSFSLPFFYCFLSYILGKQRAAS